MLNIIYFIIGSCVTGTLLFVAEDSLQWEAFLTLCFIWVIVFVLWAAALSVSIKNIIDAQLKDKHSISKLKRNKQSFIEEMTAYKDEMQEEVLENYRKFESDLMSSIKDSKLIAAALKQSGYSDILKEYDAKIKNYVCCIHNCDRNTEEAIQNMKIRQENPIYGYSFFIPKSIFYRDEEKV